MLAIAGTIRPRMSSAGALSDFSRATPVASRYRLVVFIIVAIATPPQEIIAAKLKLMTVSRTTTFGGSGGGEYEVSCPFGTVMTGLRARHGSWIDALAPICSEYIAKKKTLGEISDQPFTGGKGGGESFIRCQPPRGVVVALEVFQASNKEGTVGHIVVNCGDYLDPKRFGNKLPGSAAFLGNSQRGSRSTLKCAFPLVAGGIIGRSGIYIDRVGLSCVDYQPR